MAAIVCHGSQSHLESQIVEARTLRLRLPSSTKPLPPQPIDLSFKSCFWDSNIKTQLEEEPNNITEKPIKSSNNNTGGWSFLEALSNVNKEPSKKEEATTYVHPQQKPSSLLLSPKSLELCTESLGSESCTDIVENDIDMLCSSMELDSAGGDLGTGEQQQQQPTRQHCSAKKAKTLNFPPPLTTMRGSESLRVRPHREDGRLVIEVTRVPSTTSCFQAERSNGRLRLCFLKNHTTCFDPVEGEDLDLDENEPSTNEEFEEKIGNDVIEQVEEAEEEEKGETEEDETEEETEEEADIACGCDLRMGNFEIEMPRRCNEGGEHENNELLLNWGEPFWVATS